MSDGTDTCDECGRPTTYRVDGSTQGWQCTACGTWAVVTTYVAPIDADPQTYSVRAAAPDPSDLELLRVVSHLMNMGALELRRKWNAGDAEIARGQAAQIAPLLEQLSNAEVEVEILPPFPHTTPAD